MLFLFDINKTLAAASFLADCDGGRINVLTLIKMLYRADRAALIAWGRTITGDSYVSMDNGPVLSLLYDLIKGKGNANNQKLWDAYFTKREGHIIRLRKQPEIGYLSKREIEALKVAYREIKSVRGSIANWMHRNCPEWQNPKGSSKPIDPKNILRLAGKKEVEIQQIEEEVDALRFAKAILN